MIKNLYAPWRSDYTEKEVHHKKNDTDEKECIFCEKFAANQDEQEFILRRFEHCAVMFNRYPYNAGHLLVVPFEHTDCLSKLSEKARSELMNIISNSIEIFKEKARPDGFNIGLNLGPAGNASIPSHLHWHVLPRWQGDTNFMPTLAQTKVVSFDLHKMYEDLKPAFEAL